MTDDADAPREETQEERAIRAIRAIVEQGANPTVEAERLANEFTDRQIGRVRGRFHRRGTDPSEDS